MSDQRIDTSIALVVGCFAATPASLTIRASFFLDGSRNESGSGRSRIDDAASTLALIVPFESVVAAAVLPLVIFGAISTRRLFVAGALSSAGGGRERMKWEMEVIRGASWGVDPVLLYVSA